MKEFEGLVQMGRKKIRTAFSGSKRGSLIQLEGDFAIFTNTKRSAIHRIEFPAHVGTGTFHASEAPLMAEHIERRDDKVLFEWKEGNAKKRVLIPDQRGVLEEAEKTFEELYTEPTIKIPNEVFDNISPEMLITKIAIEGNEITINQIRSDGTVEFENVLQLSKGLLKQDNPATGEVSVFTSDLYMLREFVNGMFIDLHPDRPISLKADLTFGAKMIGLISTLKYED